MFNGTECVEWKLFKDADGYGRVGRGKLAHREMWLKNRGPIPEGLTIDHLCRNRSCVNTDHMELVTREENLRRAVRISKTECINGHPYNDQNTYVKPSGHRDCRACIRIRVRKYKEMRT